MKIIDVIFEDSRYGGPHSQSCNLFLFLKEKVYFNILISNIENSFFKKKLNNINIAYVSKKIYFLSLYYFYFFKYLFFFKHDCRIILKFLNNKNQILYVPGGSSCFKTVICGLIAKKKIIWHIHDTHSNFLLKFIFFFLSLFVWRILFASKKSFMFYPTLFIKKKCVIINSAIYKIVKKSKKFTTRKNYFSIGMIANFNPVKNIFLYLKIAKLLLAERKYKFFILGQVWQTQMDYYQKCINFIKNNNIANIKIFNKIRTDIFLSGIDLYVCTSHKESSPLSIWEALSAKIPVITTNIGDVHDLNKSNKYFAKIIYSNNEKDFATSIINLSTDLHEYKLKSKASIQCFYKNFTIKKYSEKFEKIINL